jgi:hypothetical protein
LIWQNCEYPFIASHGPPAISHTTRGPHR